MKIKESNKKTKYLFPEFADCIQTLREQNPHFNKLFEDHENLDKEITAIEQDPVRLIHGDIENLKRKKLQLKDEMYKLLRLHQEQKLNSAT